MRNLLRKFFCGGTISPPKGPDLGEKIEQKRPVAPKNRGIFVTWRLHNFICPKFRQVLEFSGLFAAGPGPATIFVQGINI
jgi:hypothetical protein